MNLYKNGDLTYYGQTMEDCNLLICWNQVIEVSQYHQRRQDVDNFNRFSSLIHRHKMKE